MLSRPGVQADLRVDARDRYTGKGREGGKGRKGRKGRKGKGEGGKASILILITHWYCIILFLIFFF